MAIPRTSPYIWVTWLAHIMSGEFGCQWQYWFQTHNRLEQKQPNGFDLAGFQVDHTRMLNDLRKQLASEGHRPRIEYRFTCVAPSHAAPINGKIDCLVATEHEVRIYDCKTGQPRTYDQLQLMVYIYAIANDPAFRDKAIRGFLLYKNSMEELTSLPNTFESNLDYFVSLLADENPPPRDAGDACRFCNITSIDCPDRLLANTMGD